MTKEILHKAQLILPDTPQKIKWVTGNYVHNTYGLVNPNTPYEHLMAVYGFILPIKIETLCEYIGFKDENNKKIFSGDIVEVEEDDLSISRHTVKWMAEIDYPAFDLEPSLGLDCNSLSHVIASTAKIRVVGNIHDKKGNTNINNTTT